MSNVEFDYKQIKRAIRRLEELEAAAASGETARKGTVQELYAVMNATECARHILEKLLTQLPPPKPTYYVAHFTFATSAETTNLEDVENVAKGEINRMFGENSHRYFKFVRAEPQGIE